MSAMDERDKKIILARRRFFIATAVAGLAATQCDNPFRPCLKVAMPVGDAAASLPEAGPTLDASTETSSREARDAAGDAVVDAPGTDAKTSRKPTRTPGPSVCLNPYE